MGKELLYSSPSGRVRLTEVSIPQNFIVYEGSESLNALIIGADILRGTPLALSVLPSMSKINVSFPMAAL